ncbi:MAG: hypothetical protein IT369_01510 [Candidatus Latescibacteria bacterium]|nr:hypothetical protein [Candidatus Latescibacterota bacterium]
MGSSAIRLAGLLLLLAAPLRAADKLEGEVGLRWQFLTQRNSVSPDYQELGAQLRLATPAAPWRQLRLRVEAAARQGLDEHYAGTDNPYQNRQQVRLALIEGQGPAGGQVLLGRQRPAWRGLSVRDTDGVSWQRRGRAWTVGLVGGYQVPYWEPSPGLDRSALQWGGMVHWHPGAARWKVAAALLHQPDSQDAVRWRLGGEGEWKPRPHLSETLRCEIDPAGGRLLYGHLDSAYRPRGPLELRLSYTGRSLAAFALRTEADSLQYHGQARDVGVSAGYRRGKNLTLRLQWRATFGERQLRATQLLARWGSFLHPAGALNLRLADHWSPWRRMEQAGVDWSSPWGKRMSLHAGITGSYFKWNTSRVAVWDLRLRPQVAWSCRAGAGIWVETRIEQTLDEFLHLRTLASAGLRYSL